MKTGLVLALIAVVFCLSSPAAASNKNDAKQLFDAGLKLMKLDDFAGAAANFERSTDLFPTQTSLFNLANCYRALQRYGDALSALERLRRDFGTVLKPEIHASAARQEDELNSLVARLTIEVTPADASITVDGRDLDGGARRGPLVLGPGDHAVEAKRAGYRVQRQSVQLVSTREQTLSLQLVVEPVSPAVVAVPAARPLAPATTKPGAPLPTTVVDESPHSGSRALRVAAWSAGAAAVVAGVLAGSFRLIADGHYDDFRNHPEDPMKQATAKSDTLSANHLAIGMGITAAALAVTAGVSYLLGREASSPTAGGSRVSFNPAGMAMAF
jgi:tetratricopeptide (TPR) repeat protein